MCQGLKFMLKMILDLTKVHKPHDETFGAKAEAKICLI